MKPVTTFVKIMERAGRNDCRAHIPPEIVRHIIGLPIWLNLLQERQQEMVSQWARAQPDLSSGPELDSKPIQRRYGPGGFVSTPELAAALERKDIEKIEELKASLRKRKRYTSRPADQEQYADHSIGNRCLWDG